MAKGKVKKEVSLEEKLKQTLVPIGEQPYEIPDNWCWTTQNICCSLSDGDKSKVGEYPYLEVKYLRGKKEATIVCSGKFIENGSKVILVDGENSGEIFTTYEDGYMGSTFKQLTIATVVNPEYLLRYIELKKDLYRNSKKGSAIPHLNKDLFFSMPFPLPPVPEQQRIVSRIESLFSKLDEVKEKLEAVVDSYETRKAAILHKAFTGELTKKWRADNLITADWHSYKLSELGILERGRSKHRPRNDPKLFGGDYPFIQTGDVGAADVYVRTHTQTLSEFGLQQSRMFPKETLCITIAANIGKVAILSYDCCFPDSVVGFTPNEKTLSKYMYYAMSEIQKDLEASAPATAQKNFSLKLLSDVVLNVPSIEEQKHIIDILDSVLEKEKSIVESSKRATEKIDLLKKSILARAFRGELGTNNPKEESSIKLLKRILAEKQ